MSVVPRRRSVDHARTSVRHETFSPQAKLSVCTLRGEHIKKGAPENEALKQLVEQTGRAKKMIKRVFAGREQWKTVCEIAGYTDEGQGSPSV